MNPGLDHDSRRELEPHALRNVSWLAAKLGYQDSLDKRRERTLMIAMGAAVAVIVAGFAVGAAISAREDEQDLARHRCEVDARVERTPAVLAQVQREHPDWTRAQLAELFEQRIRAVAANACAGAGAAR